ncbi:S-DNA-T family DNA segregation ATPase FtsK/SpoIIIE [Agromyces terreus]|uniref:S-DNA-T family DNA segregation ATPase FtsK/SpoIIIE n=1 Tax=Agromyces terreus TaxID=424795 RepID=A0A9X2H1E8_9MICO|nr:FtsK/SpoIIIE domain-containing protein [Agromyces terreus]MCP2371446.1 S-DNA-T family DNA segregation ATPase FtsK/SpoIIIE [Agromyces terreus]
MSTRLFAPPETTRLPLTLPPVAPAPSSPGFPFLAAIAPVAASLVLWFATGSVLSLAFAALGPLLAVATMLDARRQRRRTIRLAEAERAEAFERLHRQIGLRHLDEAADLWSRHPPARSLAREGGVPAWGRDRLAPVVVGSAAVESAIRIEGSPVDERDRAAVDAARRLEHAPVIVDLRDGLGIVGSPQLVRAAARAVLVQLAHAVAPDLVAFTAPDTPAWAWVGMLPHAGAGTIAVVEAVPCTKPGATPSTRATRVGHDAEAAITVALASEASSLPPGLGVVIEIDAPRTARMLRAGDGGAPAELAPETLGLEQAAEWAEQARAFAARSGAVGAVAIPALVPVGDLPEPDAPVRSRASLRAALGVTREGVLELDLVADGPHAIVAGTTGSGKSEFLLAWIRQLAAAHPPERVAFLLVDFKGGAAFEPVAALPHVAGIVTDLEEAEAERAVLSLRAELRHRERVLRAAGVRDMSLLADDAPLGRLVVVIDEFQAMVQRFRELAAVVADIASRGRSLGVHLVLASQRPNGVLGDQVTANAPIRVSLRVMNRADSIAVVGTDEAAQIPVDRPGRGIVDRGDGTPVPFQSALVDGASIESVRRRFTDAPPVRRPWLDPLPRRLGPDELAHAVAESVGAAARTEGVHTGMHRTTASNAETARADARGSGRPASAVPFGLVDEPDLQRRSVAAWAPGDDGPLLVLGAPGSGRSTALAAIEAAMRAQPATGVTRLGNGRGADWAALIGLLGGHDSSPRRRLLVLDDLDACFAAWPEEYRHAAVAALERLLRETRGSGVSVVASAALGHRLGGGLRDLFGATLHLRHASRAELAHAGGVADLWQRDEPPGAGQWRGRRLQIVDAPRPPADAVPEPETVDFAAASVAVVSATVQRDLADLRALGLQPTLLAAGGEREVAAAVAALERPVVIGDAEAWMSAYSLSGRMRDSARLVVHGGLREFRALAPASAGRTGAISLPPLLDDADPECWQVDPGRTAARRRWKTTETSLNVQSGR